MPLSDPRRMEEVLRRALGVGYAFADGAIVGAASVPRVSQASSVPQGFGPSLQVTFAGDVSDPDRAARKLVEELDDLAWRRVGVFGERS